MAQVGFGISLLSRSLPTLTPGPSDRRFVAIDVNVPLIAVAWVYQGFAGGD